MENNKLNRDDEQLSRREMREQRNKEIRKYRACNVAVGALAVAVTCSVGISLRSTASPEPADWHKTRILLVEDGIDQTPESYTAKGIHTSFDEANKKWYEASGVNNQIGIESIREVVYNPPNEQIIDGKTEPCFTDDDLLEIRDKHSSKHNATAVVLTDVEVCRSMDAYSRPAAAFAMASENLVMFQPRQYPRDMSYAGVDDWVIMHEIGHTKGLNHISSITPGTSSDDGYITYEDSIRLQSIDALAETGHVLKNSDGTDDDYAPSTSIMGDSYSAYDGRVMLPHELNTLYPDKYPIIDAEADGAEHEISNEPGHVQGIRLPVELGHPLRKLDNTITSMTFSVETNEVTGDSDYIKIAHGESKNYEIDDYSMNYGSSEAQRLLSYDTEMNVAIVGRYDKASKKHYISVHPHDSDIAQAKISEAENDIAYRSSIDAND